MASPSPENYQRGHKVGNGYGQNALHEVIRVNRHIKIIKRKNIKKLEILKVKNPSIRDELGLDIPNRGLTAQ